MQPMGYVYSSVGLGFIVSNTMLGLSGANPGDQTAGLIFAPMEGADNIRQTGLWPAIGAKINPAV